MNYRADLKQMWDKELNSILILITHYLRCLVVVVIMYKLLLSLFSIPVTDLGLAVVMIINVIMTTNRNKPCIAMIAVMRCERKICTYIVEASEGKITLKESLIKMIITRDKVIKASKYFVTPKQVDEFFESSAQIIEKTERAIEEREKEDA